MKTKITTLLSALILSGCTPNDTQLAVQSPTTENARFTVTRVGVFNDDLAYGNQRGIYVINDTKTGVQYVGVSGVGISELSGGPSISELSGGPKHNEER